MTSAGPQQDPYTGPVLNRGLFITFTVVSALLVVSGFVLVIHNLRDNLPFDLIFWTGVLMVVLIGAMPIRAARLRRSAW